MSTPSILHWNPDQVRSAAGIGGPWSNGLQIARVVVLLLLTYSSALSGGCSRNQKRHKVIWTQSQAEAVLKEALEAELPDQRRRAIERLGRSRFLRTEVSVRTLAVIVRTDGSQIVRRSAARSLGASQNIAAFEPLLLVLNYDQHRQRVRPPDGPLRRACLDALNLLYSEGLEYDDADMVVGSIIVILNQDQDRDARLAAAGLLGLFARSDVLHALVEALRQPDFAVTYEAERSLIKLTGTTQRRNYEAWRTWLANNPNPFGQEDQVTHTIDSPTKVTWWK